MAHQVDRLSRKMLFNTPLLLTLDSYEGILEYVNSRPEGLLSSEELAIARDIRHKEKQMNLGEGRTAILSISGALTYEETFLGAICGMSSYQGLMSQMRQAVDGGYKTVVLDIDSGGGQAYGCFETARELRKMADAHDIKLIAYVDGMAASAAYGLASSAHEVIVNPESEVGGVGVLVKLMNDSEMMKNLGISTTYIYAGDNKIPFDQEGEFRKDFLDDVQAKVDTLYEKFTSHVATFRNMDVDVVKSTQAKEFSSEEALELGLIDKIMERMEFADYLADIEEENKNMPLTKLFSKSNAEAQEELSDIENATPEMGTESVETEMENPQLTDQSEAIATMEASMLTMAKELEALKAEKEAMAAEALEKEKQALHKRVSAYSNFVGDVAEFSTVLGKLDTKEQDSILEALAKASAIVEDNVSEVLSIEGEVEEPPELSDKDKDKQLTREKIKAKYSLSND